MIYKKVIMVTGGAGFIGSHVVRAFLQRYPDYRIVNFDALTYAGNLESLQDIEHMPNYVFVKGDITDRKQVAKAIEKLEVTDIIHLAAESHVDRSIEGPRKFVETNIMGTFNLLEAAYERWSKSDGGLSGKRFYYISTDEVYGSLKICDREKFDEKRRYDPHSVYSASKASADHIVQSYHDTYGMETVISHCSNNYGPNQFPEKLIPLVIDHIINKEKIPVYGDGHNIRDWLYVTDHVQAIDFIFHLGKPSEVYNIGGGCEKKNIDLINLLIEKVDEQLGRSPGESKNLIEYVTDRKGHDERYSVDYSKLNKEIGWKPVVKLEDGIEETVKWYIKNYNWLINIDNGAYRRYNDKFTDFAGYDLTI